MNNRFSLDRYCGVFSQQTDVSSKVLVGSLFVIFTISRGSEGSGTLGTAVRFQAEMDCLYVSSQFRGVKSVAEWTVALVFVELRTS